MGGEEIGQGAVTPEQFTEEIMLLFSSNVQLDEMRLRIEQLFQRAMSIGALQGSSSPPPDVLEELR